jgi:hypothetical protein
VSAKIDEYIDAIGAICDIWKYDMFDFTGYASGYELASNKGDFPEISPYCDRDGMFVEEALSAYLADYNGFIDQLVVGEDGRIINPFYRHLNLGSDELQAEADRLKTWYACIHALVTDPGFDIYSYAKDINGDHYAVYKKYPYDDYTQDEKRDTLGFMWTRAKNHPIAFPTFDLYLDPDGKFTYFLNGSRETTKSSFLGRAYTKSKVHGIVTDASQFPVGFYDFDFDNSLQNLLLFAPSRQYTTQFGYKNCDVIVGCVRKYFDSDINSYYSEYDKLGNFVYYLRNRNIRKSAEQKTWRDLIGVYKNLSKVSFLYASKYLDEDGSESFYSATTLDQRNVSYALELQVEQIDFADTTKTQYDIRVDGLEYNLRRGDIAMEYSDNVMTLAYIGKNTMDNNFVVNYVEHSNNEMDYD